MHNIYFNNVINGSKLMMVQFSFEKSIVRNKTKKLFFFFFPLCNYCINIFSKMDVSEFYIYKKRFYCVNFNSKISKTYIYII